MLCQRFRTSIKLNNFIGYINEFNQLVTCTKQVVKNEHLQPRLQPQVSNFCMEKLPKTANIFGDISGRKFERVEMDKLEKEEEKFQDTEARVPRRLKPSLGQYAKMINFYISKNDLNSALSVLDLIKKNRDKPTMYIYNLLLRGYAMQGDIKQCISLYNKAKKRGLEPTAATYTSLFNVCAESKNSELALDYLKNLRQSLYEKQFPLNETHYNVMVKAYSWHNQTVEAFQLVDEMKDKRLPIGESTYNSLLHGAIAHKEAGLRHALIVWHLMRSWKIKPTLTTYNLFLRAIRDTDFKSLKLNEVLVSGQTKQTRILLKEGERPNLLASPPVLSTLLPLAGKEQSIVQYDASAKQEELINLNDVLVSNRLILFGGVDGFLDQMAIDDVKPNEKTMTLLLDLIPNSIPAENLLLKIADNNGIKLDIDFYNMLIKRRSMRFDYKAAKEVLSIAERKKLSPNIMTFGVLALGCQKCKDAKELLQGIEVFGYKPNHAIMSTLIDTACHKKDLHYLLFVMNYMVENKMYPNAAAIKNLEEFSKGLSKIEKPRGKYKLQKMQRLKENIERFGQQYPRWKKMIKDDE
ncbi:pentatricopeptide repeat-containing protein 1, mitochondrial-like [Linepithema humile]|uniref:pentatricopeptide repeat-containing protein 1, mitochondrial-like n=1 Tax=Linepithema humile TaxID=83485 RepID=UPI00351F56C1